MARWLTPARRLFQLWRIYAYLDFVWITRDFRQFFGYYIGDLITGVAGVTATVLLAERFDGIGPWNKQQIFFMLGYALAVRGMLDCFFGYNVAFVSRRIGRGQLDHNLLQPQPLWLSMLTEGFTPLSGAGRLITGCAFTVWAAAHAGIDVTPVWLAVATINFAASTTVLLCFSLLWGSLAFWAPRAAEEVSMSALNLMGALKPFPLDGTSALLLAGMLTVLPVGFIAWLPARALLNITPSQYAVVVTPAAAIILAVATAWVFTRGLKHYGRTGSQRYSAFGFRR